MKIRSLPMIVALVAAALPLLTLGEASEPSTAAAASAPVAGPRLPTAAEQRDNAATPDLRVERSTTPQLIIPLGRKTDVFMRDEHRVEVSGRETRARQAGFDLPQREPAVHQHAADRGAAARFDDERIAGAAAAQAAEPHHGPACAAPVTSGR